MTDRDPDFKLGEFSLWVHGWAVGNSTDSDDANWLRVTAQQKAPGSVVAVSGSIIQSADLARFLAELERLHRSLSGEAVLQSAEPAIKLVLASRPRGTIEMVVNITPDQLAQEHRFRSEIDQSYLPGSIAGLEKLLEAFAPRR